MEISQTLIVPLVIALVAAVKAAPWFAPDPLPDGPRRNGWLLPWIAAGLGVGLAVLWNQAWPADPALPWAARVILGLLMGLSAAGLYDGALQPLKGWLRDPLGSGPGDTAFLLAAGLAVAVLGVAGCAEPLQVRGAYAAEALAWQRCQANSEKITGAALEAYGLARDAHLDYATAKAIQAVERRAVGGQLPVADFSAALDEVVRQRDAARDQTARVRAKVLAAQTRNRQEAARALGIHEALADYLAAGPEAEDVQALVDEAFILIRSVVVPASASAPSAPAAPPAAAAAGP
jgi:hypothetical protein